MGLIYEYSSPDDRTHREPPRAKDPGAVPAVLAALDAAPPRRLTTAKPKEATPPDRIRGADVAVASLFSFSSFCIGLFISAFIFTPPPPEEFSANPEAFQINIDGILAASESSIVALYSFSAVHFALAMITGFAYVGLRLAGDWSKLGLRPITPQHLSYAVAMGALGALGLRGGTILATAVGGNLGELRASLLEILGNTSNSVLLVGLILWIMVLPLAQELFFRGVLYNWLRGVRGMRGALLIHGLINGLINLYILDIVSSILVSVGLAYIYERTGSLLGSYLAHTALNFLTVVFYVSLLALGG